MTPDQRQRIEAAACADCGTSLHTLHTGEKLCDLCLCKMDIERHGVLPPGWQRPLTLRETLAAQAAEIAAKDQRIAELEGLLREARHDMHYLIRCVTSESSTDMELTKHATMRFAGEIETIEKIEAALGSEER